MPTKNRPSVIPDVKNGRAPYETPRLVVHGTVAAMTEAQPSSPQVGSGLVEAQITFLGRNV
jgi:hypothetical protein